MKKILNANALKIIAVIAMVADHIAAGFIAEGSLLYIVLRTIGKITMPVMCFFIAEGFFHTHDLKKYVTRLAVFAVISHFPYVLYFAEQIKYPISSSIFVPLLCGLIALWMWKDKPLGKVWSTLIIVLCFIVSIPCDWSCMPVMFILIFGLYHDKFGQAMLRYAIVAGVYACIAVCEDLSNVYMGGLFLAIPLLCMYSGELGKKSKVLKWGFYVFYPVHLVGLYLLSLWLV